MVVSVERSSSWTWGHASPSGQRHRQSTLRGGGRWWRGQRGVEEATTRWRGQPGWRGAVVAGERYLRRSCLLVRVEKKDNDAEK